VKRTGALAFDVTPEEALPCAEKLLEDLKRKGKRPSVERAAWDEAPYRTTLSVVGGNPTLLYEVQGALDFHQRIKNFAQWLAATRKSVELSLVSDANSTTTAALFVELRATGTGLMLLKEDQTFEVALAPQNPALQVTFDPDLRLGELKSAVLACVRKFNASDRKDGLRDLCELVEKETKKTLLLAVRKGVITIPAPAVTSQDFSDHINTLGSRAATLAGRDVLVDSKLKDDLHSFRGARNLVDHPCATKHAEAKRQRQFPERVMMGARLAADLLAIRRKLR
jgi:hypothetical protein